MLVHYIRWKVYVLPPPGFPGLFLIMINRPIKF